MGTFKSAQKSAKKSVFANKSAQKSTLKSTFGSSEPIWKDITTEEEKKRGQITRKTLQLDFGWLQCLRRLARTTMGLYA